MRTVYNMPKTHPRTVEVSVEFEFLADKTEPYKCFLANVCEFCKTNSSLFELKFDENITAETLTPENPKWHKYCRTELSTDNSNRAKNEKEHQLTNRLLLKTQKVSFIRHHIDMSFFFVKKTVATSPHLRNYIWAKISE